MNIIINVMKKHNPGKIFVRAAVANAVFLTVQFAVLISCFAKGEADAPVISYVLAGVNAVLIAVMELADRAGGTA